MDTRPARKPLAPSKKVSTEYPFSLALAIGVSLMLWLFFRPGVLSLDSMMQYQQAVTGRFTDWHPPLMALALALVLKAGGSLSEITLLQILAGLLGMRCLILGLAGLFGLGVKARDWLASLVILLLISPLTPLGIYLATFWKDTWLAILMLWSMALLLETRGDVASRLSGLTVLKLSGMSGLLSLAMLIRYNAPIIYVPATLVFGDILRRMSIKRTTRILLLLFPVLLTLLFLAFQSSILKVEPTQPQRGPLALDLASMIVHDPSVCNDLSLGSCDLVLGVFSPGFLPGHGAIDFSLNEGSRAYQPFVDLLEYPQLQDEFIRVAQAHPYLLLSVKLLNLVDYLGPDSQRYFYPHQITVNEYGLSFARDFAQERSAWFSATDWVLQNPIMRWFSFVHAVWLVINIVALGICGWRVLRFHDERAAFIGSLLLLPASYYGSYLIAFTASEFRFMYPSMLVVQVITLTFLFSLFVRARKN